MEFDARLHLRQFESRHFVEKTTSIKLGSFASEFTILMCIYLYTDI